MKKRLHSHFYIYFILSTLLLFISACGSIEAPVSTSNIHQEATPHSTVPRQPSVNPLTGPVTYVALGASDAVGVGSNEPGSQGYVPLIAGHLPKGSRMLNLGISGIRLHEALSQELPLALTTAPRLVTIWLVANDFIDGVSYESYTADLNTLLAQLSTRTQAHIVMANLPDLTRLPAFAGQTEAQKVQTLQAVKQWNTSIAQAATRYGVTLVDLFNDGSELTAHPEYISGDGFHPSAAGYVRLADLFWNAIKS